MMTSQYLVSKAYLIKTANGQGFFQLPIISLHTTQSIYLYVLKKEKNYDKVVHEIIIPCLFLRNETMMNQIE